jgi:hypothetical protein
MVVAVKFETFVTDLATGTHGDALDAPNDTDVLKVMLTLTTPDATADAVVADLPADEPTGSGYQAGGDDVTNTSSKTGGTITLTGTDIVWTATAADWDDFRYATLYNDTPTSPADPLITFYDYGSTISLGDGETFTFNIVTNLLTIA